MGGKIVINRSGAPLLFPEQRSWNRIQGTASFLICSVFAVPGTVYTKQKAYLCLFQVHCSGNNQQGTSQILAVPSTLVPDQKLWNNSNSIHIFTCLTKGKQQKVCFNGFLILTHYVDTGNFSGLIMGDQIVGPDFAVDVTNGSFMDVWCYISSSHYPVFLCIQHGSKIRYKPIFSH